MSEKSIYKEIKEAFDFYNVHLFNGELPPCIITLNNKKSITGYYKWLKFIHEEKTKHSEISLNAEYFSTQPIESLLANLVHNMAHHWQHYFGKPSAPTYHNSEYANKLKSIGLMPSSTGEKGGKETGQKMSQYIIQNGKFAQATKKLLAAGYKISWYSTEIRGELLTQKIIEQLGELGFKEIETKKSSSSRLKYSHYCNHQNKILSVMGKPNLNLVCGECQEFYLPENSKPVEQ